MLDIFDINYELCSEKLGLLNFPSDNLPKKGFIIRVLSLFKGSFYYVLKRKNNNIINQNAILFFTIAENEILSIKDIASQTPNSYIFGIDNYKNGFPIAKIYFYSLFYIPIVFYRYLVCQNKYHKRAFPFAFDGFCIAYSSNHILKKYLKSISPKKIIIANQTSFYHRSLAYVAKELKIETIYVQHASITKNFSDLNLFTSALLEGEDSLIKIQTNLTMDTNIYLIGMPKFDKYAKEVKDICNIKALGICSNGLDDFDIYENLLKSICTSLPDLNIIVRPHPSDRRREKWVKLAEKYNASISDVKQVKSFEFFKSVDTIIAGDSNIHLEAALLNIPSIYFDPLESNIDWYGFSKNKLVYYAESDLKLISHIKAFQKNIPFTRSKAKFYIETIETNYDGKSSLIASLIIQGKIDTPIFNMSIDKNRNNVYRLTN